MSDDYEPIDPDRHYDLNEVARIVFHRQRRWLYRNLPVLITKTGFPKPIAPVGQRYYSGQALLNWVHREQITIPRGPGPNPRNPNKNRLAERIEKAKKEH